MALRDLLDNVHGPLYGLLLHVWGGFAGDSEWSLRAPSALCGVAMVPAMAWLAARWLGRKGATPAAWLTAGSPFLVWYSQEARNYSMLMLCVTLSGAALLELRRTPGARGLAGYLLAAGAGMLSNFSFALIAPLHLRWWIAGKEGRSRRLALLGAALVALTLAVTPWVPQVARIWDWQRLHPGRTAGANEAPLRGATLLHPAAAPYALYTFAAGYTLGPSLRELRADSGARTIARHAPAVLATVLVFGALGLLGLAALQRRGRLTDALMWLVIPIGAVSYFAFQNFKVFHPRYLAVSFPCCLLVMAAGLADLRPRARVLAALAIGILWLVSLQHLYFDPRYGKEDYRGAAALVRARGMAGERLLAVNTEDPMVYYYRGPLPKARFWLGLVSRPQRMEEKFDEALAGASGAWVVLSRPEDLDPGGVFVKFIERRYPTAERVALEGVRVWHIRLEGGAPARAASGT
jgi:mannosyltransferase